MMKWVKAHGTRPLDEFIELAPYTQTREYMKKVLDIYSRYCGCTKSRTICPTMKVDADFIENEIDY